MRLLEDVEIIIANGSPEDFDVFGKQKIARLVDELSLSIDIRLLNMPEASFFERINELSQEAAAEIVTLLGDEDLFVYDCLPTLYELFRGNEKLGCVTGRFIDVHGFIPSANLKLSVHEGWIDDYHYIGSPYERLHALKSEPPGVSSMSYAVMKRGILAKIAQFSANNQNRLSFVGFEKLLNIGQMAMGEVVSVPVPMYLRDRTFVDRATSESFWSNPDKDIQINQLIAEFLSFDLKLYENHRQALSALKDSSSLIYNCKDDSLNEVRTFMDQSQPSISAYLSKTLDPITYALARQAWRESAQIAFSGLKLSVLGLHNSWLGRTTQLFKAVVRAVINTIKYS